MDDDREDQDYISQARRAQERRDSWVAIFVAVVVLITAMAVALFAGGAR